MGAVYSLASEDFSQWDANTLSAYLGRWVQAWATNEVKRVRFVFRAVPFDLSAPLRHVRQVETSHQDSNALRHLREYTGLLTSAGRQGLMAFKHYLVLPEVRPGEKADTTANKLMSGMGLRAYAVPDLPPLLETRYTDRGNFLAPVGGNHPLCSVLVSHDLAGAWNWSTLANVLCIGFAVDVSVEIVSYYGGEAVAKLEALQTLIQGLTTQLGAKVALSKMGVSYNTLLAAVHANEALHQVAVGVLVKGETEKVLRQREHAIEARLAGQASVRRLDAGRMKEVFTTFFTSADKVEAPRGLRHNMSSTGLTAVLGPLGLRRRDKVEGVYWGLSGHTPLFWDGFGPNLNEPNHGVFLGATGSGKTASCLGLAWREINLRGTQVIMMDPMDNCRHLVEAVGPDRASYIALSLQSLRINPVERLYEGLPEQASHLAVMIGLLLNRDLSEWEQVALDHAAQLIYEGVTADTPAINQPRLQELADALRSLSGGDLLRQTGYRLGELIYEWYVRGSRAVNFNTYTQTDWRLKSDLIAFSFKGIPPDDAALRRQTYYLVLSSIHREISKTPRLRPRIIQVDEFRVMSTVPMLAQRVAEMYKTFRTWGAGVWALEQDALTFTGLDKLGLGGASSIDTAAGMYILSNSTFVTLLAHRQPGAEALPLVFPQLTPAHVKYIAGLKPKDNPDDKGRGLMCVLSEEAVYPLKIQLSRYELAYLGRS